MTVRYSHLSREYQLVAVERLVPNPAETASVEPTDTTADTKPPAMAAVVYVH
jgi:hypothetical protein